MIKFKVIGKPVAKGRPRFARRGKFVATYTPKKTQQSEDDFKTQSIPHRPATPFKKAIRLTVNFSYIKPKSRKKNAYWTTKPDTDNLVKLVKDSMNGIFWIDDSQVVELIATKHYGEENYTEVILETLEDEND